MYEDIASIVDAAESAAADGNVNEALRRLRKQSLMDFGELLLSMPNDRLPELSKLLPRMAPAEIQQAWTGASGRHLLAASVDFVRMIQIGFSQLSRKPLDGADVLDFGCGYGRLARLMYWFTDPENYVGVDPWDRSLELCREDGLLGTFLQTEYVPNEIPVGERRFDLIFSFSVFTHTSLRVTRTALQTLRRYVRNTGVLVLTVRPIEFWPGLDRLTPDERQNRMDTHRKEGFAFSPISFPKLGDEFIFGDTTIDPGWFAKNTPEWRLERYDRGLDGLQTCLFFTPN